MAKSIYTRQYDVFKELLREVRQVQKVTQAQMSKRLTIPQSRVSNIELGERRMDVVELSAWCDALDMSLEGFVTKLDALWRSNGLQRSRRKRPQRGTHEWRLPSDGRPAKD